MEFFALSGLLNAVTAIGLASFIYFRSPKDPRHWTFGLFGIATGIWSLGYFFWQISDTPEAALFNLRILMAGAIFIPVTFLHHVLYLLREQDKKHNLLLLNYSLGGVFLLSAFTPQFIVAVQPISIFPFWGVPGLAFHFCLVWWFGLTVFAHYLLLKAYRHEKGLKQRQFLFLLVGSAIGYLGGASNFPLWYGIEVLPYGTALFALYISLVAYTLMRFHWLDFSVHVERGFSYFAILLLISQPVYPALLLAQKAVFGTINLRYSLVQLFLHMLTVVGAYQMKVGTKGAVARTILKSRELRLQVLSTFSSKVSHCQDLRELSGNILETLGKGVGASQGALFIFNYDKNRFEPLASFGFPSGHPILGKWWTITDDLPQLLMFEQCRVSVEALRQAHELEAWGEEIVRELEMLGIGWCFPFFGNGQLLGFLVIGPVNSEFFGLLGGKAVWDTMIREATLALENLILRNEVYRSQQLLCQMDRIRSLEVMTEGLTQELKSPLVSMKVFVQMAQLRRDDGEFVQRMEQIVGKDWQSVEHLTSEIRGYVKAISQSVPAPVSLHELVDTSLIFFSSNPAYRDVVIEKEYAESLPEIVADRQRLLQGFFNGLLFLLKDNQHGNGVLHIETAGNIHTGGKAWVKACITWKMFSGNSQLCPVSLEGLNVEDYYQEGINQSPLQGLVLASRIIQQQFGIFRLLTFEDSILGFQIDLPQTILAGDELPCISLPCPSSLTSSDLSPLAPPSQFS